MIVRYVSGPELSNAGPECPLLARSRPSEPAVGASAPPHKADQIEGAARGPLMTQSGPSIIGNSRCNWLRRVYRSPNGEMEVGLPRVWSLSGECRLISEVVPVLEMHHAAGKRGQGTKE